LEHAGIKPAATTDEILEESDEDIDFNTGSNIKNIKEGKKTLTILKKRRIVSATLCRNKHR